MKKLSVIVTLLVCACFLFSFTHNFAYAEEIINFSKNDSPYDTYVSESDVIDKIYGDLSDYERERLSGFIFKYSGQIPPENVVKVFDGETLCISATEYSYTALNGKTVVWIPESATYLDSTKPLVKDGDTYTVVFAVDADHGEDEEFSVQFRSDFTLDKNAVNGVATKVYDDCKSAKDQIDFEQEEYDSAYSDYLLELSRYNAYLKAASDYQTALSDYENYLKEDKLWLLKNKAYQDYLAELSDYQTALSDYENYLKAIEEYNRKLTEYNNYSQVLEEYSQKATRYGEYVILRDKAQRHLDVMELIRTSMSPLNRTVYSAILGNSVTQVLERKDELGVLKADSRSIRLAEKSTKSLRAHFNSYFSLETDVEKYNYYCLNYESIVSDFETLFCALDKLYHSGRVASALDTLGKADNYYVLLCQLMIVSNALDDNPVYDYNGNLANESTWSVEGHNALYYLGQSYVEDKNDCTPLSGGYPAEMQEPVKPEKPTIPQKPTVVVQPVPPEKVESDGERPISVAEPQPPVVVDNPVMPKPYEPNGLLVERRNAFVNGYAVNREKLTEDPVITERTTLKRSAFNVSEITVKFTDEEGNLLDSVTTEEGGFAEYTGEIPQKEHTEQYDFAFDFWVGENGEYFDVNSVYPQSTGDVVILKPHYKSITRIYEVTFLVEGESFIFEFEYGTSAEILGETADRLDKQKLPDGDVIYKFLSWDRQFSTVTQNTFYTAVFESNKVVEFKSEGVTLSVQKLFNGDIPTEPKTPQKQGDDLCFYAFSGWDKEIVPVDGNKTYNAIFDRLDYVLLTDAKNGSTAFSVSESEDFYKAQIGLTFDGKKIYIKNLVGLAVEKFKGIEVVTDGCEFKIDALSLLNLKDSGAESLSFEVSLGSRLHDYKFKFTLYDGEGTFVDADCKANVKFIKNFDLDIAHSTLTAVRDGKSTPTKFSAVHNESVSFSMFPATVYNLTVSYGVNVVNNDVIGFKTSKTDARENDLIRIIVDKIPLGVTLKEIKVTDSDGNPVTVTDGCFRMPVKDVDVMLSYAFNEYLITFVAEGKVISSGYYKYGESVNIPVVPDFASEGFSYTFKGWSEEITTVTDDFTYTAVFEKTEIPEEILYKPSILLTVIKITLVVLGVGVVTLITVITVKKVKKKRGKQR